jgi:hypothetical protein
MLREADLTPLGRIFRPARGAAVCAGLAALVSCKALDESNESPIFADAGADANNALQFDGVLDYATSGTAQFPPAFGPQSLSMWVKYPPSTGTQIFITLRRDTQSGVAMGMEHGTIAVWSVYGNETMVAAPSPPAPGSWHHVAFVYDPADAAAASTLYVDGVLSATGPATTDNRTPLSSWIGSFDGLSQFYQGDIDELRIWDVARTADEIVQEMNGEVSASEPGLVAYFNCDAIYGTRVLDMSGNGNDMTLGGGVHDRMPALVPSDVPPSP